MGKEQIKNNFKKLFPIDGPTEGGTQKREVGYRDAPYIKTITIYQQNGVKYIAKYIYEWTEKNSQLPSVSFTYVS